MPPTVGLIGLGLMGKPMGRNLTEGGISSRRLEPHQIEGGRPRSRRRQARRESSRAGRASRRAHHHRQRSPRK